VNSNARANVRTFFREKRDFVSESQRFVMVGPLCLFLLLAFSSIAIGKQPFTVEALHNIKRIGGYATNDDVNVPCVAFVQREWVCFVLIVSHSTYS
jgi:hypothetical protein